MRGLISTAGYVPYHRLRRDAIPTSIGGAPGKGTRSVASWDEDATTMAVAAARQLGPAASAVASVVFSTSTPAYLDKTNATALHAALRLPRDVRATDAGGAPRSAVGAMLDALQSTRMTLIASGDVRTGAPGGPDERENGDAAAAAVVGSSDDGVLVAEFLGHGSATAEFLDRYRPPTDAHTLRWEERFGETQYAPLAQEAWDTASAAAGVAGGDFHRLIVTGLHARATRRVAKTLAGGRDILDDDLSSTLGNAGTPQPLLLLTKALEEAAPGEVIALVVLADGCDVLFFRATGEGHRASQSVQAQIDGGVDTLDYLRFLTWRGNLTPEPPRRPAPARASASASARSTDWKFGFAGSQDLSTGAVHLPPARVSRDGGAVDQMTPIPMADVAATIRTFTIDHLSWSPSPPTIFAVLDFDAGEGRPAARYPCALTDVDPSCVAIGDRVELTFRRLGEADGVVNYFWKARPLSSSTSADSTPAAEA